MRAKVVVFPIKGRNWCFSQSIDSSSVGATQSPNTPSTFKQLYNKLVSPATANTTNDPKLEILVDFVANKMNGAWSNLGKAPEGSIKNKIHGFGLKLLSRVKPSEILFKSIPKETDKLEIIYPSSLSPRLVRRRLRHIAFRGSVIHKKYFYSSAILLPLTSVFMVLPLPNVPFFWILFRTYSHWRASQGSEKLLHLVSDASYQPDQSDEKVKGTENATHSSDKVSDNSLASRHVLQPSEELQKLLQYKDEEGLNECTISKICDKFYLNSKDVVKYRESM